MKEEIAKKLVMLGRAGGKTQEELTQELSTKIRDDKMLAEALTAIFSVSDEKFEEQKKNLVQAFSPILNEASTEKV